MPMGYLQCGKSLPMLINEWKKLTVVPKTRKTETETETYSTETETNLKHGKYILRKT